MSANQNKEVYAVDDAVDDASKGHSEHLESGVDLAYEKKMMLVFTTLLKDGSNMKQLQAKD
jgi:hypothetical protein